MAEKKGGELSRRDFLRNITRLTAAAGLAGIGGILLAREGPVHNCIARFVCRGCRIVSTCCLPQAQSFRTASFRTAAELEAEEL